MPAATMPERRSSTEQQLEFKTFPFEIKASGQEGSEFEGLLSPFYNLDDGGDIVDDGAFDQDLPEFMANGFIGGLNHDWDNPIGRPQPGTQVTPSGLFLRANIIDTIHGADVRKMLKAGVVRKLSIGYQTLGYSMLGTEAEILAYWQRKGYTPTPIDLTRAAKGNARLLTRVLLFEGSPVTVGMNRMANISAVKAAAELAKTHCKLPAGRFEPRKHIPPPSDPVDVKFNFPMRWYERQRKAMVVPQPRNWSFAICYPGREGPNVHNATVVDSQMITRVKSVSLPQGFPTTAAVLIKHSFGTCSGILIGDRYCLTAAHGLRDAERAGSVDKMRVVAGASKLLAAPESGVDCIAYPSSYVSDGDEKADIALLRLKRPIGCITGWFGLASVAREDFDDKLFLLGYSDNGLRAACCKSGLLNGWIELDFESEAGNSGAGLYCYRNGERYVCGVLTASTSIKKSLGVRLTAGMLKGLVSLMKA